LLKRSIDRTRADERGITGLETAIILIAFVVVAAVFAFSTLSAGLFSSQKSQESIHSGLKEAKGCLELRGGVLALANTTGSDGYVGKLTFTVLNAMDGEPVDFTPPTDANNDGIADSGSSNIVVISYVDKNNAVSDLYWSITKSGGADSDYLLERGEQFVVAIGKSTSQANLVDALTTPLSVNSTFTMEVKPSHGAVLAIERTTPGQIDSVMNLR